MSEAVVATSQAQTTQAAASSEMVGKVVASVRLHAAVGADNPAINPAVVMKTGRTITAVRATAHARPKP